MCLIAKFSGHSQNFIIEFEEKDGTKIPFVTAMDINKNLFIMSDSTGLIILEPGEYQFRFELIGMQKIDTLICGKKDDIIKIVMENRATEIEGVSVIARKKEKLKIRTAGEFKEKFGGELHSKTGVKLGYAVKNIPKNNSNKILRSIKFKLSKAKGLNETDFNIEFKIYPILSNYKIDTIPLNRKPIIVPSGKLRNKSEIIIKDQEIEIPDNGIFVSLEVPDYKTKSKNKTIKFNTSVHDSGCNYYIKPASMKEWPSDILINPKYCRAVSYPDGTIKYPHFKFGITYFE